MFGCLHCEARVIRNVSTRPSYPSMPRLYTYINALSSEYITLLYCSAVQAWYIWANVNLYNHWLRLQRFFDWSTRRKVRVILKTMLYGAFRIDPEQCRVVFLHF